MIERVVYSMLSSDPQANHNNRSNNQTCNEGDLLTLGKGNISQLEKQ